MLKFAGSFALHLLYACLFHCNRVITVTACACVDKEENWWLQFGQC